jgi:hypothetical protein
MSEQFRYKAPELEVNPSDPFAADRLRRREIGEVLSRFLGTLSEPFVIAIDAPWGAGKSTFLKMWIQQLRNDGFQCLFFNAWETDFAEAPLIALIGEV